MKKIAITGHTRGIGKALAERLDQDKAQDIIYNVLVQLKKL